jgi:L-lactate dehydrogenase
MFHWLHRRPQRTSSNRDYREIVAALEKLAVVGAGSVGGAVAYASTIDRLADEVALYDIDGPLAEAQALDLSHGLQFVGGGYVVGSDDIEVCSGADLIVVTAGATHRPGGTRLDLASTNVQLIRDLVPRLLAVAPDALLLFVTNPVDVVTYMAQEAAGLPHGRVIGSGTVLDSSRLRHLLAGRLGVSVSSVHAMVVGEHGDSEVVLWSSATVGGTPLLDVVGPKGGRMTADELEHLRQDVRQAGYRIIEGKGNTNLAIGLATARIARCISRDERAVLPVSVRGTFEGTGDVCLSLPSVVGRAGVLWQIPVPMNDAERDGLGASAAALRKVIEATG